MTDAGDRGQGSIPPPPPPPVPPGGWQAPTPAPPSTPPPAPPHHGAPPPTAPAYPAAPPPSGYGQPQAYGQPMGYGYPTAPRNDGMAIAALCCGIAAIPLTLFCGLGVVLGILGLVFGLVSMRKIERAAGALTGRGMALAGVICGAVGLVLSLGYWVIIIIAASDSNAMGLLATT